MLWSLVKLYRRDGWFTELWNVIVIAACMGAAYIFLSGVEALLRT